MKVEFIGGNQWSLIDEYTEWNDSVGFVEFKNGVLINIHLERNLNKAEMQILGELLIELSQ